MSETNVGADANAPVLSGTFESEVHIVTGPNVDALAEELIERYGPRKAEIAIIMGTQQRIVELETSLNRRFAREDQDRVVRQQETDTYREAMDRRMERIETVVSRSLWTSAAALLTAVGAFVRGETRQ